jgi:predicted permease
MLKDLRHGARSLLQAKGWTAVIVLSLALGIGANTTLFSAVNGLFLRTLPVRDPDALVRLKWGGRNDVTTNSSDYGSSGRDASGQNIRATFSYAMFRQFVADNRTMDDLFACAPYGSANVVVDGTAEIASAFISTGNYYRALGLTAYPGRTIVPDDDRPGAPPVAVISARYWRTRFANDPTAVGKIVQVNGVPVTIVGVIAPQFPSVHNPFSDGPAIGLPLALDGQLSTLPPPPPGAPPRKARLDDPTSWWLQVIGRMKPGVTVAQVQANLEGAFQHTARAHLDAYLTSLTPEARSNSRNRTRKDVPHLIADSGSRGVYNVNDSDVRAVTILTAVVILVLLIVCANVANLLLSRATTRQKEISIRLSLGATRPRLIRQLLTESLLLAAIGGAIGVLVAKWSAQLLPGVAGQAAALDWRVLAFALAVTGATGIVFGIAPALRATALNVSAALKETSRSVAGSRSVLSTALLVLQVAVSLVLLVAAGLFLRTLHNLRNVDVGFNTRNLVLFRINPSLNRYDDTRAAALIAEMTGRLQALPGVRAVAVSNVTLLANSVNSTSIFVQGRTYADDRQRDSINNLVISPDYFKTMEIPIVRGRGFTDRDSQTAPKVVVINETAARNYFPNENPVGKRIGYSIETSGQLEIVGVLRDAKYDSVREAVPPTQYVPQPQAQGRPSTVFHVRTAADPAATIGAIREAVRTIDPNLPLMGVSTQVEQFDQNLQQERVFAQAYAMFGGLAMLLASIGLFGLMSYSVARRTNEIGIRMALGAQRADVLQLVMRESMALVAIGIATGLAVAVAASRLVASLLFGLAATDASTLLVATVTMAVVSAVAGYLPARRASLVDPMVALHYE